MKHSSIYIWYLIKLLVLVLLACAEPVAHMIHVRAVMFAPTCMANRSIVVKQ